MSPFVPGMDVVCIVEEWEGNAPLHSISPIKNCIYKIKDLYLIDWHKAQDDNWILEEDPDGELYLTLYECPPNDPPKPVVYAAACFRPVKHTNIEIFRNLLVPTRDLETV